MVTYGNIQPNNTLPVNYTNQPVRITGDSLATFAPNRSISTYTAPTNFT
jgi:hypothetical protein